MSALLVKPSAATGEIVSVSQERAGWQTVSLRIIRLSLGQKYDVSQLREELALVVLGGQAAFRAGVRHWQRLCARASGYHPVVAAHGYDCYYLNVLAGSARSMAASDDPDYAWVRGAWNSKDPRLPLVG